MKRYLFIDENNDITFSRRSPNDCDNRLIEDGVLTVVTISSDSIFSISSSDELKEHIFYNEKGDIEINEEELLNKDDEEALLDEDDNITEDDDCEDDNNNIEKEEI